MLVYKPLINAGHFAGDTPMVFQLSGINYFKSKEECDAWIVENTYLFAPAESGGCIYTAQFDTDTLHYITGNTEDKIMHQLIDYLKRNFPQNDHNKIDLEVSNEDYTSLIYRLKMIECEVKRFQMMLESKTHT